MVGSAGGTMNLQRVKARGGCAGDVQLEAVAHVQDRARRQAELGGGVFEDDRRWLGETHFEGNGEGFKIAVQFQRVEQAAQALVPVGDDGKFDLAGSERIERREDIVIDTPGIRFGEALV